MADTYLDRNRGYITSSKLKLFMQCPKCYYYKYVLEIPDPTDEFADKDHFLIGQATDDLITYGKKKFDKNYEVVARRSKDAEKTQLTNTHWRTIAACEKEFRAQPLFNQKPKKEVLTWEYAGLKLRAELDDVDNDVRMIKDLKSCANVNKFDFNFYVHQMSFYQWGKEEQTQEKYEAMLEIFDKYKYFSRSMCVIYTKDTLEAHRGQILEALERLQLAEKTGIYASAREQKDLYNCPYYGYEGHGRPTEPVYY